MIDHKVYAALVFCTLMHIYFLIVGIYMYFTPVIILYFLVYVCVGFYIIIESEIRGKNRPVIYFGIYTVFMVIIFLFLLEHSTLAMVHWEEVWKNLEQSMKSQWIVYSMHKEGSYIKGSFVITLISFFAMLLNLGPMIYKALDLDEE